MSSLFEPHCRKMAKSSRLWHHHSQLHQMFKHLLFYRCNFYFTDDRKNCAVVMTSSTVWAVPIEVNCLLISIKNAAVVFQTENAHVYCKFRYISLAKWLLNPNWLFSLKQYVLTQILFPWDQHTFSLTIMTPSVEGI